jgi:serine/threonine protein phosphatase 1
MDIAACRLLDASSAAVPPGTRVYAVGDIHGRADLLELMLGEIEADAGRVWVGPLLPTRLVLVFLGDLVDRGSDSRAVMERLARGRPDRGPLAAAEWVCLRGNHEDFMTRFLADFSAGPAWMRNGGLETVRSYAGDAVSALVADYPSMQQALYRSMPPAHLRFLARLRLRHMEGDYLFVHAGLRPGVPLDRQDGFDLMWIRDDFLFSDEDFGKIVVHGHSVATAPEVRANRIGIDTGAYRTGRLTCLALEGNERRFIAT